MIVPTKPANEQARLDALEEYRILDSLPEQAYDDITYLASQICNAPIALISLVDGERQWFKSRVGLEATETSRDLAFCAHAIHRPDDLLIVSDATQDERFAKNPLVTSDPNIRFYAGAPLKTSDGCALGTLCVIDRQSRELTAEQEQALRALSRQVMAQLDLRKAVADLESRATDLRIYQDKLERYQHQLEEANEALSRQTRTDPLTAVANRTAFDERLEEELHRARRNGHPLALLLLDVDRFKSFNDDFGHAVGDAILKQLAEKLSGRSRTTDLVARFGGEEFAVILPNTDLGGAAILAERFRRMIEGEQWDPRPVTVSIGATVTFGACTALELIDRADQALYDAKRHGRNRVVEAPYATAPA